MERAAEGKPPQSQDWVLAARLYFFILLLFLRERERERERERDGASEWGGGEREVGLHQGSCSPDAGLELMNREFMPEPKSGA